MLCLVCFLLLMVLKLKRIEIEGKQALLFYKLDYKFTKFKTMNCLLRMWNMVIKKERDL